MQSLAQLLLAPLPILVVVAALTDLTRMKIPNWISASLIVAFFPVAFAAGLSPLSVATHLGLGALLLLGGMVLFALRVVGGGDAKLIAATGLWLGSAAIFPFLVWTAILGGAFSLVLLLGRGRAQPYLAGAPAWVSTLFSAKGDIPYGVAICGGTLMAFPSSAIFQQVVGG
jgi:prepilin peptidase CpaA